MFKKCLVILVLSTAMMLSTAHATSYCSAEATDCGYTAVAPQPAGGYCNKKELGYRAGVTTFYSSGAWYASDGVMCPFPPF